MDPITGLGTLAVFGYLYNQKNRERNFQQENSVTTAQVAQQYMPFTNQSMANNVACPPSYPAYNVPSIERDPNYVNYINSMYNSRGGNTQSPTQQNQKQQYLQYQQNPQQNPYQMYQIQPYEVQTQTHTPANYQQLNYQQQQSHNQAQIKNIQMQNQKIGYNQQQQQQQQQQQRPQNQQQRPQQQSQQEPFVNLEGSYLPISTAPPSDFPQLGQGSNLLNNHQNYIPANDPTAQFLTNIDKRPIVDFEHNNMVPYFGSKVTQNMAGTGVKQGNYVDGVTVDSGFDNSTPWQTKLASFTGNDDTYRSKREVGPLYSPAEQQTGWVFGQPQFREDSSQFTQSLSKSRNDLTPIQAEKVGPGLNLDPSIPAAGGYHEFTRILPNNVSDYKANQLENRINEGKFFSSGLPEAAPGPGGSLNKSPPGVVMNRPPRDWSQARRPTMTSKIGIVQDFEMMRSDYDVDKRPNNSARDQTSYGYGSVININGTLDGIKEHFSANKGANALTNNGKFLNGSVDGPCVTFDTPVGIAPGTTFGSVVGVRDPTYMSSDNNIRSVSDCNSVPIGNPANATMGSVLSQNYYVNETDRGSVNPQMILQTGLTGQKVYEKVNYNDAQKTTMKETTSKANTGTGPSKGSVGSTFWTYNDNLRATMKETTTKANTGAGPSKGSIGSTFWTYSDAQKTTMKETTTKANTGTGPSKGSVGSKFWTYSDSLKPTINQSTLYSYAGDPSKGSAGSKFWTYEDSLKPTINQSTLYSYAGDPSVGSAGSKFWTFEDSLKPTIKQSTNFSYFGPERDTRTQVESSRFQYTGLEEVGDDGGSGGGGGGGGEGFSNLDYNKLGLYEQQQQQLQQQKLQQQQQPRRKSKGSRIGGANTNTIRGSTLVLDYIPGAGRANIRQDPDQIQGRINFGSKSDQNYNGPGTLYQSLPTATFEQNARFFAEPTASPNKLVGMDDRQLAWYQVEQLHKNPLSMYTIDPNAEIPNLYANNNPDNFSELINIREDQDQLFNEITVNSDASGPDAQLTNLNVYPLNGDPSDNSSTSPNKLLLDNLSIDMDSNPLLQGSSRTVNSDPEFSGRAYSGKFSNNGKNPNTIADGGPKVYGSLTDMQPLSDLDRSIQNGAYNGSVCKPNDSLTFAGGVLMLGKNFN